MIYLIKTLSDLKLYENNIGSQGAEHIAIALQQNKVTLISINLSSNHIGPQGVQYLAKALRQNQALRTLNIIDNQILDEGKRYAKNI
ncbi:unnamed protein product, partial [Adineta steineri]